MSLCNAAHCDVSRSSVKIWVSNLLKDGWYENPIADALSTTAPLMWWKYLKYVQLDPGLDSIFKVDSVSQHVQIP